MPAQFQWVTGPDGIQRWIPSTASPQLDSNGFPTMSSGNINPWSVLGGNWDSPSNTITYPDGSTNSQPWPQQSYPSQNYGVQPVSYTSPTPSPSANYDTAIQQYRDSAMQPSGTPAPSWAEPTPIPNSGGITATGPTGMFSGPMDFPEMSSGMPTPTPMGMPSPMDGVFYNQITQPPQNFQMAPSDFSFTGTPAPSWAEPSPIPYSGDSSMTTTGFPDMFGQTYGSLNTGGTDMQNFGGDMSLGNNLDSSTDPYLGMGGTTPMNSSSTPWDFTGTPVDPWSEPAPLGVPQDPSITVMGDSPNVATSPTTDPSGSGLVSAPDSSSTAPAPPTSGPMSPYDPNYPYGVVPQSPLGPVGPSGVGFGGHGTTGTGVGPNTGWSGSGFYGGTVPLANGAVTQQGTGMDPFLMSGGGGGLGIRGTAVAEQTSQGAAPMWWFMHGGTQESWDAMVASSPVKQPKQYNVSAQEAAAAANYWNSSSFHQPSGTSGTTI